MDKNLPIQGLIFAHSEDLKDSGQIGRPDQRSLQLICQRKDGVENERTNAHASSTDAVIW